MHRIDRGHSSLVTMGYSLQEAAGVVPGVIVWTSEKDGSILILYCTAVDNSIPGIIDTYFYCTMSTCVFGVCLNPLMIFEKLSSTTRRWKRRHDFRQQFASTIKVPNLFLENAGDLLLFSARFILF